MHIAPLLLAAVLSAASADDVDFDTEVVPILTSSGCNAGACHGAAAGRGGLHLSLLGMNPAFDYEQLARQWEGRRINLARPDESLLVRKPTEQLEHGGGQRFATDSVQAEILQRWIAEGAKRYNLRKLVRCEIDPPFVEVQHAGDTIQLRITAYFDDGSSRDVTQFTRLFAEDASALQVNDDQSIRVLRAGQHTLIIRYLSEVRPIVVRLPLTDEEIELTGELKANFIDEHVLAALKSLRIPVSPQADDATFARRIWLDLTGSLPEPEELHALLDDTSADPRARLIDRLLASDRFTDYWTLKLAQQFRVQSGTLQAEGARAFYDWLHHSLANQRSYDSLVQEMVVATGDSYQLGPANFVRAAPGPRELGEFFSEALLGIRLRCANCHDHPLDRWTQDDYHGLAAIFARVSQQRVVQFVERGEVTHPRTGDAATPRIPGAPSGNNAIDRQGLAQWLRTEPDQLMARAMVNRVWKDLMGRGLVEPVDDLRATNPATHPALLDELAQDFVSHQYDLRHLVRTIVSSAAYSRSAQRLPGNEQDDRFYSRAIERSLMAEVLSDSLAQVTGVWETFADLPVSTRAVMLFDSRIPSPNLDVLGRCSRDGSCLDQSTTDESLPRTLHLVNGALLNEKITSEQGRLRHMLTRGDTDEQMFDEFYLRALSRLPRPDERAHWLEQARQANAREAFWEDFLWALLNCREFRTNH